MTVFRIIINSLSTLLAGALFTCSAVDAASETKSTQSTTQSSGLLITDWEDELNYGPGNYASFTIANDNQRNRLLDAFLYIPVNDDLALDAGVSKHFTNDVEPSFTTKSHRYGIGSTQASGFNLHIGASSWGKTQTFETSDLAVDLSYQTLNRWRTGVQYERGDVTLFIKPAFSNRLNSINSDRSAWGVSTSYTYDKGAWWLSYLKKDYERNLSALNSSFVLQLIIQSIALDQAYALSSDEYNLGYEWYFGRYDLSIQFNRVTSVVDDTDSDFLVFSNRYYLNETFSIQTSAQNSLNENLLNLSVELGVLW